MLNSKLIFLNTLTLSLTLLSCSVKVDSDMSDNTSDEEKITELKNVALLRESLELADSLEVIMSYLEIPKNTTLPTHYHPGEEFVYLLEGSGELTLEDSTKVITKTGDVRKIPLKFIHGFSTLDETAKIIVFRVHPKGKPERFLVE